jgi:hypothetical protein
MSPVLKRYHLSDSIAFLFTLLILGNNCLYGKGDEKYVSPIRLYLNANSTIFTGTEYPTYFTAVIGDPRFQENEFYATDHITPSGKMGLGGGIGVQIHEGLGMVSLELDYSSCSRSDGNEVFNLIDYSRTQTGNELFLNTYSQSKRNNSILSLFLNLGIFPFKKTALSFYGSMGLGMGWQSFKSGGIAYAKGQGYDVLTSSDAKFNKLGDYNGEGNFNRRSFVYAFGVGSEFLMRYNIGIKFDYQYILSSYTKRKFYVASNYYLKDKLVIYRFANRIALGVSYYFNLSN